jgi:NAD(P)H-hydrate epimerase
MGLQSIINNLKRLILSIFYLFTKFIIYLQLLLNILYYNYINSDTMNPLDMMVVDFNAEYLGIPRLSLMENAGRALAYEISKINSNINSAKVIIFTGPGGNGGDGFVAARHLLNMGFKVKIVLLTHPSKINSKDSIQNWNVLENMRPYLSDLEIEICYDSSQIDYQLLSSDEHILIDAILGTGIKGVIREPFRSAINLINKSNSPIVSVDVPSGMDPLNGEINDISVEAEYTVSFHRAKTGLKGPESASSKIGKLIVCDIGIPKEAEIFLGAGDLLRLKSRDYNAHKGANGRLLIVGGSKEYAGAPALAGLSALAAGADLVTIICPDSAAIPIKSYSPDLIVKNLPGEYINPEMLEPILELSKKADCVLLGCGAGDKEETKIALNLLAKKLGELKKPMVMDADALKLVDKELVKNQENLIITPHMGEFKAFFQEEAPIILFDIKEKISAFQSISQKIKGTILLKGKLDMIFNGKKFRLNKTGSPGMTVGGTGDCLAGLVAALYSQSHSAWDSACLGAFINGRAGELAQNKWGYNFSASKMIEFLSEAMKYDF